MSSSLSSKPWLRFITSETDGGGGSQEESTPHTDGVSPDQESVEATSEEDNSEDGQSEEEFDADRAMAKIRKINAENKRLRDRAKTAEQQAQKSTKDLEAENEALKTTVMRLEVATELGLPSALATRLQGSTREEIQQDAEALLGLLGPRRPGSGKPGNDMGEGHGAAAGQGEVDYEAMIASVINP